MEQMTKVIERIEALRESIADIPATGRTRAQELQWYMTTARIDELKDFFGFEDPLPVKLPCTNKAEAEIGEIENQIFNLQMLLKKKKKLVNYYNNYERKRR